MNHLGRDLIVEYKLLDLMGQFAPRVKSVSCPSKSHPGASCLIVQHTITLQQHHGNMYRYVRPYKLRAARKHGLK